MKYLKLYEDYDDSGEYQIYINGQLVTFPSEKKTELFLKTNEIIRVVEIFTPFLNFENKGIQPSPFDFKKIILEFLNGNKKMYINSPKIPKSIINILTTIINNLPNPFNLLNNIKSVEISLYDLISKNIGNELDSASDMGEMGF